MWSVNILSSGHFRCRHGCFRNRSYNLFIVTFYIIFYCLQKIILFIMGSQISSGNRFSTFRMEITESSSDFFYKYPIQIIFFTRLQVSVFIKQRFLCGFIILKNQILLSFSVIGIFTCYAFQYRHEKLLPFWLLYISS